MNVFKFYKTLTNSLITIPDNVLPMKLSFYVLYFFECTVHIDKVVKSYTQRRPLINDNDVITITEFTVKVNGEEGLIRILHDNQRGYNVIKFTVNVPWLYRYVLLTKLNNPDFIHNSHKLV